MECPKFQLYNSLLPLSGVAEMTAFQVVKKYKTEESLRHTLALDPNDIYSTVTEGGTKISGTAADSIRSKFGSCAMVPPAAARMPVAAFIPPPSQSSKRLSASTTRARPPYLTPGAENHSIKRSPAVATSLGSFKKKSRFSTPLRTALPLLPLP